MAVVLYQQYSLTYLHIDAETLNLFVNKPFIIPCYLLKLLITIFSKYAEGCLSYSYLILQLEKLDLPMQDVATHTSRSGLLIFL